MVVVLVVVMMVVLVVVVVVSRVGKGRRELWSALCCAFTVSLVLLLTHRRTNAQRRYYIVRASITKRHRVHLKTVASGAAAAEMYIGLCCCPVLLCTDFQANGTGRAGGLASELPDRWPRRVPVDPPIHQ